MVSILRPALRDYGGQVAHGATKENKGLFHGPRLPAGTLAQEGVTSRPWVNEGINEEGGGPFGSPSHGWFKDGRLGAGRSSAGSQA